MKKISFTIVSVAVFLIVACVTMKVSGHSGNSKENQYNKNHQKTGYWIEHDTITASEIGILNPIKNDNPRYNSKVDATKITQDQQQAPSIQWGNTTPQPIIAKGLYVDDHKQGEWKYYLNDTIVVKKIFYSNNAIDSMLLYSKSGRLILEGHTDWKKDEFVYRKLGRYPSNGSFPLYFLSSNKNWNWIYE